MLVDLSPSVKENNSSHFLKYYSNPNVKIEPYEQLNRVCVVNLSRFSSAKEKALKKKELRKAKM